MSMKDENWVEKIRLRLTSGALKSCRDSWGAAWARCLGVIFLMSILGIPQICLMVALFGVVGVLVLV